MTFNPQTLRAAAEKATPGEWFATTWSSHSETAVAYGNGQILVDCAGFGRYSGESVPDATYIALANPQTILALLDRLAAAEELTSAARRAEKHLRLHEGSSGWRGGEAEALAVLSDTLAAYDRATAAQGEAT